MRGKVPSICKDLERMGITPACAGKSPAAAYACPGTQDHPRMCREKRSRASLGRVNLGSPPRMRGKAGTRGRWHHCFGDHPRMCGEKETVESACRGHLGSPPHVRGKACSALLPACWAWDHPRMCGEKPRRQRNYRAGVGSPPHMRGKDPVLYLRQCLQVRPNHARHLVHLSFLRA